MIRSLSRLLVVLLVVVVSPIASALTSEVILAQPPSNPCLDPCSSNRQNKLQLISHALSEDEAKLFDNLVDKKTSALRIHEIKDVDHLPLVAIIVSIFSALLAGLVPYLIDRANKKKSIVDDFWARQVIFPLCIKPALDFSAWVNQKMVANVGQTEFDEFNNLVSDQYRMIGSLGLIFSGVMGVRDIDELGMLKCLSDLQDAAAELVQGNFAPAPALGEEVKKVQECATSYFQCSARILSKLQAPAAPSHWWRR